jgi:hypothetical protein
VTHTRGVEGGGEADTGGGDAEVEVEVVVQFDAALAERLGEPPTPDAIYLEEASRYRPIATGDIFEGVAVPGPYADAVLAMVVAHPSAMRKGAAMEEWAKAAPVAAVNGVSKKKWTRGHLGVFPLPHLAAVAGTNGFDVEDRPWGALLDFSAPIETANLDVQRRVACLSPDGIHLLLQRLVHADTRVLVREDTLATVFAPKLEELEMLQTWNEELVLPNVEAGGDLSAELAKGAQGFEEVMNASGKSRAASIRELLESGSGVGAAHKLLSAEIRMRRGN